MNGRLSLIDVAASAAHLIVLMDDPKTNFRGHRASVELHDALMILRSQCEALGLMTGYKQDKRGRYILGDTFTPDQPEADLSATSGRAPSPAVGNPGAA